MDVYSKLAEERFVWDSEKASVNLQRHGVRFEDAREVFFDPLASYRDASTPEEQRLAVVGVTYRRRLLYVVHIEREGTVIRLISARRAEPAERRNLERD